MQREATNNLKKLKALAETPAEQARYALELLETERNRLVVLAALEVLADAPSPEARALLLKLYAYYDADGPKRDGEGSLRATILKTLRGMAQEADARLFEHAVMTYEYAPPNHSEEAKRIRSEALLALDAVDATLAGYHAVRLLVDEHTSPMSGEPALTAARVLAANENTLPLYQYTLQRGGRQVEVVAECLKGLQTAPTSVLATLVEHFRHSTDEVVLVGLFDLLLAHKAAPDFVGVLVEFLNTTPMHAVYHYLVTALVVSRKPFLWAAFKELVEHERDPRKIGSLLEALALAKQLRETDTLTKKLRTRLVSPA